MAKKEKKQPKPQKRRKPKKEQPQQYLLSPLNNPMLNYRVYVMGKSEKTLVRLVAFLLGGIVGLVFYGNLFMRDGVPTTMTHISNGAVFVILGLLANKFVLPIYVENRLTARSNILKQQFRSMLESLTSSFSTGSNVQNAFASALEDLKMQYSENDFIVQEMQEIINGTRQNISIEMMLRDFAQRSGNEDIASFADVFEVCYRKGGNMNFVIHRTHTVMSDKMAVADEIETKLTSNKLQHNVMSIMPIIVVLMLRTTNEAFAVNFATPVGVLANTVAIGIFVGSYIYGNKIVAIKE
ncbi:MAG: type II secretion system F family protein [Oscillospiraceae bacterium]|nr:type II secretion system F family protein [Oscillospiraceae bacterium]